MTFVCRILIAVVVTWVFSVAGIAQQSAPPANPAQHLPCKTNRFSSRKRKAPRVSQADAPQQPLGNTPSEQKTAEGIFTEEEHQRMLGVVPMFGTTNYRNPPPLTSGQKFELMTRTAIDPFTWFAAGAQAGISQAENEFGEYGQGAAGYGKRYSATYMDSLTAISSATSSILCFFGRTHAISVWVKATPLSSAWAPH